MYISNIMPKSVSHTCADFIFSGIMWRCLDGVKQPKKKKMDAELAKTRQCYDQQSRKREFQPSWLQQFDWLEYRLKWPLLLPTTQMQLQGQDQAQSSQTSASSDCDRQSAADSAKSMFCHICCDYETTGTGTLVTGGDWVE